MFFLCPLDLQARQRLNAMNDIGPDNARRLPTRSMTNRPSCPRERLAPASVRRAGACDRGGRISGARFQGAIENAEPDNGGPKF